MRTTIELKDDLYHRIITHYGKRKISMAINDILAQHFLHHNEDMFGVDPWLQEVNLDDLRDEDDRDL